ncbi:MAG: TAXI family TRAP transporter solute-binding subunit [Acidocella sp.]|nr:TAXI family TRAP transporter solute-binding subunit [Acidocella sp.]
MKLSRRRLLGAGLVLTAGRAWADTPWSGALVMGTGRPGGDYSVYGPAWGRLAAAQAGVDIAYRASGGATANILLIDEAVAQLGMTTLTVANEARTGTGTWTAGAKFQSFRALFPMFSSVLQIVSPRATGITTISALAGQVIGIGPDGGSGAATVPSILASIGVIPKRTVTGDYPAQIHDMLAGKLDACAFIGAPPLSAITHAALNQKLSLIGLSSAESAHVGRVLPGMTPMTLKAGSFPGQNAAVSSVGMANIAIATASLPASLATAVTLAALHNQAALAKLIAASTDIPSINAVGKAGVTFHPGAAAALHQSGQHVPDEYIES